LSIKFHSTAASETYKGDNVILVGLNKFPSQLPTGVALSGQTRPAGLTLIDAIEAEIPGLSVMGSIATVIAALSIVALSGKAKIARIAAPIADEVAARLEELQIEFVRSDLNVLVELFVVLALSVSFVVLLSLAAIHLTDTEKMWQRLQKALQLKLPDNNFVPLWKYKKAMKDRSDTCFYHFSAGAYKLVIKL
jgi:hypothetical protein